MSDMHLAHALEGEHVKNEPTRTGFGRGLLEAGKQDEKVVGVCADLTDSTKMGMFAREFPDRYFNAGAAEQNLVTVGSGLASMGKIPFVSSYAAFNPGRNWEQIRTTICLNDQPVKVVGSHAGVSVGPDGATHQMLEDIALMRVLPNMVVVVPGDSVEAEKATLAIAKDSRPAYLRLARAGSPVFTTEKTPFELGKAYVYHEAGDVTIISTGNRTYEALIAVRKLRKDGINAEVIHCPTIKPIDEETIVKSAYKTGAVVTVEEGQMNGGLGGAVAEVLSEHYPVPIKRVGMKDRFGESGKPDELPEHFGLTSKHITFAVHEIIDKTK